MEIQRHGCTPGTRLETLSTIKAWTGKTDGPKIFWMTGAIGTGKTTIMHSICDQLNNEKRLGASFFCSESSPCCRATERILPTIAYQLGNFSNKYLSVISGYLSHGLDDAAETNVSTQFDGLITTPLTTAKDAIPSNTVIVIDALDGCFDVSNMQKFVEQLLRRAYKLPIKFLLASRPNSPITQMFSCLNLPRLVQFYNIDEIPVQVDIHLYLTRLLNPATLPSLHVHDIDQLSTLAGHSFLFATIVGRYLLPAYKDADIDQRQSGLLTNLTISSDTGCAVLDRLYTTILSSAFDGRDSEEVSYRQLVLWTIACIRVPMTTTTLAELVGLGSKDIILAIQPLWPIFHLSSTTGAVSLLHTSFCEFLFDPKRSGIFYCNKSQHSGFLAVRCFIILQKFLRFNICDLETSTQLDEDIPGRHYRVAKAIPSVLLYACCHWADHLKISEPLDKLIVHLNEFLRCRLLFWMEILNLKQLIEHGEAILLRAFEWLSQLGGPVGEELRNFVLDAYDFVRNYSSSPASQSTPHIYISALPFVSRKSRIYTNYWPQTRGLLVVNGGNTWQARKRRPWDSRPTDANQSLAITSVALSPDGARVVSGLLNGTIYIWDSHNGSRYLGPINGHTRRVRSAAFSPDGIYIVSGSDDGSVRAWNSYTGLALVDPSSGHSSAVLSVAFSPEGSCIISGSRDCTIRLHSFHSGVLLHKTQITFDIIEPAESAMFSPDGSYVLFTGDKTIYLCSIRDGAVVHRFTEHTSAAHSVAFSPDGKRVASGSNNGEILVWDVHSGARFVGPFSKQAEAAVIMSIAFSPDGTRILSGSLDGTISMWDAYLGTPLASPFQRHSGCVSSILFSPDGNHVVSGSEDSTIRFWRVQDLATAQNRQLLQGLNFDRWELKNGHGSSRGWLRDQERRLALWIPFSYDGIQPWILPPCVLLIHPCGSMLAEARDVMIGLSWHRCYIGLSSPEDI